jgi:branched-chain amino acid transport system permease protein
MTMNYDIVGGLLGYINLSQGVFFGLSGYAFIITLNYLRGAAGMVAILASGLLSLFITVAFATVISFPYFRLRPGPFVVVTIVVFLLMERLAYNLRDITGGSYGIYLPPVYMVDFRTAYFLGFLIAVLSILLNHFILRSKLGLAILALRESEESAMSLGIKPTKYKSIALIISSIPTALIGIVYVLSSGYLDPNTAFGATRNILPVIMAMLGGSGTLIGPVTGVIILRFFDTLLWGYLKLPIPPVIVYGTLLMLTGRFMPGGIIRSRLFLVLQRRL